MMQTSISDLIDYLQSERVPTQNLTYSGGSNSVGRTIGGTHTLLPSDGRTILTIRTTDDETTDDDDCQGKNPLTTPLL
jgi:hypothetical protein